MDRINNYAIYVGGKLLTILRTNNNLVINEKFKNNGCAYQIENILEPFYIGKEYVKPCFAKKIGLVRYKWVAECDDGSFNDESRESYETKEECYCYMRDAALEKMKWNTEFSQDFDNEDDSIGYSVSFSQNEITHFSYSGRYIYKIIEVTI